MRWHVVLLVALPVALSACGDGAGEAPRAAAPNDSVVTLKHDLPSGRFELPTARTPAPNLWITLPAGYGVRTGNAADEDVFFLVAADDTSAADSTAVTPGFMRVYVGSRPQEPFDGASSSDGRRVMVAGRPLQWRVGEERTPDGRVYLKRELSSADLFGELSPELARRGLVLHIYVAGGDSTRVAQLMEAAESVSIVP